MKAPLKYYPLSPSGEVCAWSDSQAQSQPWLQSSGNERVQNRNRNRTRPLQLNSSLVNVLCLIQRPVIMSWVKCVCLFSLFVSGTKQQLLRGGCREWAEEELKYSHAGAYPAVYSRELLGFSGGSIRCHSYYSELNHAAIYRERFNKTLENGEKLKNTNLKHPIGAVHRFPDSRVRISGILRGLSSSVECFNRWFLEHL